MKKCNFCNVNIKDNTDHCPLCGGVLEGDEPGINTYPNVLKKEKAISFIFRLTLFLAIIASAACIII
ncbi:MAG: zinc ribbon domain-containing protein, partial [Lachnospiraceae bacterium]|nr:zinc ribbon domain-containing protein [Lachnospiraceae bacterium]